MIQHLIHICGDEDVIVLHGMLLFLPLPNSCHSNVSLQFLGKPELASSLNLHIGQENVNSSKTLPFLFLGIDGLQLIIYYDMFHLSKKLKRFRVSLFFQKGAYFELSHLGEIGKCKSLGEFEAFPHQRLWMAFVGHSGFHQEQPRNHFQAKQR